MYRPFVPMVLSIIAGILLSYYFNMDNFCLVSLLLIMILFYTYTILKDKSNYLIIVLIFVLLGSLITNLNKKSSLEAYRNASHDFIGLVDELIDSNDEYSKYVVIVKEVDGVRLDEKIILTVIGEEDIYLGDYISFYGNLEQPDRNTNPMLFNYRLNLLSDKIHNTMSTKDYTVNLIKRNDSFFYALKDSFKRDVKELFDSYLMEDNAKLMSSIILGDSSYLEESDLENYRDLGLAHILAVSGLHIGMISGFIMFIISRLGINRRINVVVTLSIIWVYSYLIGFPPSTIRAGLMFTILYYSQLVHEPYDSINTIMFSILVSLMINPFYLFHIGFQLSYLATLSIVVLGPKVKGLFYPLKNNTIGTIASILAVNIGLFPIQSYYFNSISILGLAANLITVPLLSSSLILGMVMIFFNYTIPIINSLLGAVLDFFLYIQWIIVGFLGSIPFNTMKVLSFNIVFIICYYLSLALIFEVIDLKSFKRINKTIVYYLVLLSLFNIVYINLDNHIEIDFIDVGQGDSILIKGQGGNYLMDTGGSLFETNKIGEYITLPYLEKHGIKDLEAVIITHFDEDHSQGLTALLGEIDIKNVYASNLPIGNKIIAQIKEYNIPIKILSKGDIIYLDKNTKLSIIWPDRTDSTEYSQNNLSLVSLMTYKNYRLLFTGDMEKEVENIINDGYIGNVDILKVGHHGSKTSSTEGFLRNTRPKYSVISLGRDNFYGHPNDEVVERLEGIGSTIYRTDEDGMIRVILNDDSMEIIPYLHEDEGYSLIEAILYNYNMMIFYLLYYLVSYLTIKKYTMIRKEGEGFDI